MRKLWLEWAAIVFCEGVCLLLIAAGAPVFVFFPVALGLPLLLVAFRAIRNGET